MLVSYSGPTDDLPQRELAPRRQLASMPSTGSGFLSTYQLSPGGVADVGEPRKLWPCSSALSQLPVSQSNSWVAQPPYAKSHQEQGPANPKLIVVNPPDASQAFYKHSFKLACARQAQAYSTHGQLSFYTMPRSKAHLARDSGVRERLSSMLDIRTTLPSTRDMVSDLCQKMNLSVEVEVIPHSDGGAILWIGDKSLRDVLVYCHGQPNCPPGSCFL